MTPARALMGIGTAGGENRAAEAAKIAISSPLLEESVEGAMGILLNITGGHDLGLFEVNEAAEIVQSAADAELEHHLRRRDRRRAWATRSASPSSPPASITAAPGPVSRPRDHAPTRRDRDVTMDDRQRSSLEIRDDEIDIPSFLKDR